jgi:multicomponent K+:H+ antiporter subunit D
MMTHWPILPVLIPIVGAMLAVLTPSLTLRRVITAAAALALVALAARLVLLAGEGATLVYALGGWPAPYGIALVLDRTAALMIAVTAALALPALIAAFDGADRRGRYFHSLFLLQVAGLNGAFLAGDMFNLFVCFEILLIASYALLVHGGGRERIRAGLAYVVLNLTGSAVFLIALALLYGVLGTLNLGDAVSLLPSVPSSDQALLRVALALLVSVFALKAALLPILFWLPVAYAAASAPVAALFAIMTKVGVYALLRLSALVLPAAPATQDLLSPWLTPLAISTVALGALGAIAAARLSQLTAYLVLISSGALLAAVAAGAASASAAALAYIPHTTLTTAGLFILAGRLAEARGETGEAIEKGPRLKHAALVGAAFIVLAIAVSGMPPLSGFIAKLLMLHAFAALPWTGPIWAVLIISGFAAALALARAASAFFWEPAGETEAAPAPRFRGGAAALLMLAAASPLLTIMAAPITRYAHAAAEQLHDQDAYVRAMLPGREPIERERRP